MSRNEFSTFAVAGVGGLGRFIVQELAEQRVTVIALTRGENNDVPVPPSVIRRTVDYGNPQSLADALKGVDVVVSSLSGAGFQVQNALADAAKAAGVRLFVPSEFGVRTPEVTWGPLLFKVQFQQYLKSLGLAYTLFYTGSFSDLGPRFGLNIATKTAAIVGAGNSPISWVTRHDIGRFVAYILTHVPADQLSGGVYGVEGSRLTLLEALPIVEELKLGGGDFTVTHRDTEQVKQVVIEKGAAAFADYLSILGEDGICCTGKFDATYLVPNFTPTIFADAVAKYW